LNFSFQARRVNFEHERLGPGREVFLMATVARPATAPQEDAAVLPCNWRAYVELMRARGDRPYPLYTYNNGRLTVVSPRLDHETTKSRLDDMIGDLLMAAGVDYFPGGSVTIWGGVKVRGRQCKGAEPDLCYYLREFDAVKDRTTLMMGADPPPHLAVEVAVSHDPRDILAVLHHYQVPEVWVARAGAVLIKKRNPTPGRRRWDRLVASEALPFVTADELTRWAFDLEKNRRAFRLRFRAWVDAVITPRLLPGAGGAEA
jgi:Uma2 family endonuclease